jgi:porin
LNQTHYADYRTFGNTFTKNNFCSSDGFDFQLTQVDKRLPYRGLYTGGTIQYAPPQQNVYTQYYEWRWYYRGLLKARPMDMTQFMVTNLQSSKIFLKNIDEIALHYKSVSNNNTNISAAWVAHLRSGIWANVGLEYSEHPTTAPKTPNSLVAEATLVFYL